MPLYHIAAYYLFLFQPACFYGEDKLWDMPEHKMIFGLASINFSEGNSVEQLVSPH